jgi:hypothetical protein
VTAHPRRMSHSEMARVVPDKPANKPPMQVDVGSWTRPSEADRALVRAAFKRNGADDLAEALGLLDPDTAPQEAA